MASTELMRPSAAAATAAPALKAEVAPAMPDAAQAQGSELRAFAGGRRDAGGQGTRARTGAKADGAGPGVEKGGGGDLVGFIQGDAFVPSEGGEAPPAPGGEQTAATGQDGVRAYVGTPSRADATKQVGKTKVTVRKESKEQLEMIVAAVARAKVLLDGAIVAIGNPKDAKTATALTNNFHSTDKKVVSRVSAGLKKIRAAFNGTIPIAAEKDTDSRGYVIGFMLFTDIHLCAPWFADKDPDQRARTLIHECSHKYDGTDDHAYHWQSHYATISTKKALDNADSYAWFCLDVL